MKKLFVLFAATLTLSLFALSFAPTADSSLQETANIELSVLDAELAQALNIAPVEVIAHGSCTRQGGDCTFTRCCTGYCMDHGEGEKSCR